MSKYYLTEAYGNLYNPRKADETFYENLRFVDYLMQEEIEEVMESLLWEFMDYGNTLDESYNLIESVFSDDVILEEALFEAVRMSPQRMAQRQAERQATLQQVSGEKAQARKEARKAAVTGALRSAGKAVQGAATGVGSAAMGAMRAGKQAAAGAYDRAKGKAGEAMAALRGVVRKGVRKGVASAYKAGRSTERAGREAERTRVTTTTTSGGGRDAAPSTQTTVEKSGGAKRRAIGSLLARAGKKLARGLQSKSTGMSRSDYEERKAGRSAAARSAVGEPFSATSSGRPHGPHQQSTTRPQGPKAPAAQGPRRATSGGSTPKPKPAGLGLRTLEASGKKPVYNPAAANRSERRRTGGNLPPSTPLTPWNKGPDKSGKASTAPTTVKAERGKQIRLARTQREEFELLAQYIMEDFINEGYADNYEDAFEILENLSEESILELTEMYLEG
jgi:hypothetical protein